MDLITELLDTADKNSGRAAFAMVALRLLCEAYSSLKNGGGLVGIFRAVVWGQNIPKVVAVDYHEELKPGAPKPPEVPNP